MGLPCVYLAICLSQLTIVFSLAPRAAQSELCGEELQAREAAVPLWKLRPSLMSARQESWYLALCTRQGFLVSKVGAALSCSTIVSGVRALASPRGGAHMLPSEFILIRWQKHP